MLDEINPELKRNLMIFGAVIVCIIIAVLVLPPAQESAEQGFEKVKNELALPEEDNKTQVQIIEKTVVVPGTISVSDDVRSYSEEQIMILLKNRDVESTAHKYAKGYMRAATGAEFNDWLAALKNSPAEIGYVRATDAAFTAFWGNAETSRHSIGAGYMIVRTTFNGQWHDQCYALALVMAGSKPAIAAVSATSTNPEKDWFFWTNENTPGDEAYIVILTRS